MEIKYKSKINGEFYGWAGDTIFQLMNGTLWKQHKYEYRYTYMYCPNAKIWKDGSKYYLDVDGMNKMLQVVKI